MKARVIVIAATAIIASLAVALQYPKVAEIALSVLASVSGYGPDERGLSPGAQRPYSLPLNNPSFVDAALATHMDPEDLVVGVVVRGRPRAYPWWILRNYHIVNDTVTFDPADSGTENADFWTPYERRPPKRREYIDAPYIPLFITLCEACSGASAFIPSIEQPIDQPLVFGQCRSRGNWAGDYTAVGTYTICDTRTHSRWHPFTGEARSGPLAGRRMRRVPVSVERWTEWVARFPNTIVVAGARELRLRTHATLHGGEMGGAYWHPTFTRWVEQNPGKEDVRLGRTALVLGITAGERTRGFVYPLEALRETGGVAEIEFAGVPYLFIVTGSYRAVAFDRRHGGAVQRFTIQTRDPLVLTSQNGTLWNELGEAVEGTDKGGRLDIVPDSYLTEWSEWSAEHPGSEIFTRQPATSDRGRKD